MRLQIIIHYYYIAKLQKYQHILEHKAHFINELLRGNNTFMDELLKENNTFMDEL